MVACCHLKTCERQAKDHLSNERIGIQLYNINDIVIACLLDCKVISILSVQEYHHLIQCQTSNHIPNNAHPVTMEILYYVADTCP